MKCDLLVECREKSICLLYMEIIYDLLLKSLCQITLFLNSQSEKQKKRWNNSRLHVRANQSCPSSLCNTEPGTLPGGSQRTLTSISTKYPEKGHQNTTPRILQSDHDCQGIEFCEACIHSVMEFYYDMIKNRKLKQIALRKKKTAENHKDITCGDKEEAVVEVIEVVEAEKTVIIQETETERKKLIPVTDKLTEAGEKMVHGKQKCKRGDRIRDEVADLEDELFPLMKEGSNLEEKVVPVTENTAELNDLVSVINNRTEVEQTYLNTAVMVREEVIPVKEETKITERKPAEAGLEFFGAPEGDKEEENDIYHYTEKMSIPVNDKTAEADTELVGVPEGEKERGKSVDDQDVLEGTKQTSVNEIDTNTKEVPIPIDEKTSEAGNMFVEQESEKAKEMQVTPLTDSAIETDESVLVTNIKSNENFMAVGHKLTSSKVPETTTAESLIPANENASESEDKLEYGQEINKFISVNGKETKTRENLILLRDTHVQGWQDLTPECDKTVKNQDTGDENHQGNPKSCNVAESVSRHYYIKHISNKNRINVSVFNTCNYSIWYIN